MRSQLLLPLAALLLLPMKAPLAAPAGRRVSTFSIVAFDPDTGDLGVAVESRFFMERGERERGLRIMEEATRRRVSRDGAGDADRGDAWYDLARFYSLSNMPGPALESLEKAFRLSPVRALLAAKDSDLDPLREDPRYNALLKDVKDVKHAPRRGK